MITYKPNCAVCGRHVDVVDTQNVSAGVVVIVRCHGQEERYPVPTGLGVMHEFRVTEAFKS